MSLPDEAARLAALHPAESFVVSAPAGSGKTALLAARCLALLARGGHAGSPCDPRSILAVTFTEKAAVEMQDRVAGLLRRARDPSVRPEKPWDRYLFDLACEARRAHGNRPEILDNPQVFRIGTFHSFCASVVRGWPAEAGVPAGVGVLAEERQETALKNAVLECLRDLGTRPCGDPHRTILERRLAALGNRQEALARRLCALLRERDRLPDVWGLLGRGDLEAAESHLRGVLLDHVRERLAPAVEYFSTRAALWESLCSSLGENPGPEARRLPAEVPGDRFEDLPAWIQVAGIFLTEKGTSRASISSRWGFPSDLSEDLKGFIKATPRDVAAPLAFLQRLGLDSGATTGVEALLDYLDLAAGSLAALAPHIPGRGMDFLELELAASRALGGSDWPSDPLIFYDAALRHILVDECQDLNPNQAGILGLLLEGWEPGDGRSLFLVGDPKQSIYRFRGSEISLFERIRSMGVPRTGSGAYAIPPRNRLALSSNFRSDPALVQFSNDLFSQILPAAWDEETDDAPMESSQPARTAPLSETQIRVALFPYDNRTKEKSGPDSATAREAEAAWIASEVGRIRREWPTDTVGILIPRRTRVDLYARAFAASALPVRMVEGEKLSNRPEVFHLNNLLVALARSHDDLAWAGVIRAPWSRVDDAALARICPAKGSPPGSWRKAILEGSGESSLRELRPALLRAQSDMGREEIHQTLQRAWEELGGPRAVAARYGPAGVANCLAYVDLVRACAGLGLREALEALGNLLEGAYTPPDPASTSSPIQLMTVHQAKGLEFDHVFAVGLEYDPFKARSREKQPILALPLTVGGQRVRMAAVETDIRSPERVLAYEILLDLDKRRQSAEIKRLFYVACTRARRRLTLTAAPPKAPEKKGKQSPFAFSAPPASPLNLLITAAGGMRIPFEEPAFEEIPEIPERHPIPPPRPTIHFEPRPSPYRLVSASDLGDDEGVAPRASTGPKVRASQSGRAFGTVFHRVMETVLRDRPFPSREAIVTALAESGFGRERRGEAAGVLLNEARDLCADPTFAAMIQNSELLLEWPLEHHDGGRRILVGRMDLVVVRREDVIALDFKTSRPREDQTVEAFHEEMRTAYGSQMKSYLHALKAFPPFGHLSPRAFLVFPGMATGKMMELHLTL